MGAQSPSGPQNTNIGNALGGQSQPSPPPGGTTGGKPGGPPGGGMASNGSGDFGGQATPPGGMPYTGNGDPQYSQDAIAAREAVMNPGGPPPAAPGAEGGKPGGPPGGGPVAHTMGPRNRPPGMGDQNRWGPGVGAGPGIPGPYQPGAFDANSLVNGRPDDFNTYLQTVANKSAIAPHERTAQSYGPAPEVRPQKGGK
jgi:hypothetical protein